MHRNSQRRPYRPFGYYFITTNVSEGFVLLDTDIFGFLLAHTIHLADHVHLIVQLGSRRTISDYLGSMKRNFSRQANVIIERNFKSQEDVANAYPGKDLNLRLAGMNKFKWQYSYHSHLISSKRDFDNHVNYILKQHVKHSLRSNKFCFVDKAPVFEYR